MALAAQTSEEAGGGRHAVPPASKEVSCIHMLIIKGLLSRSGRCLSNWEKTLFLLTGMPAFQQQDYLLLRSDAPCQCVAKINDLHKK